MKLALCNEVLRHLPFAQQCAGLAIEKASIQRRDLLAGLFLDLRPDHGPGRLLNPCGPGQGHCEPCTKKQAAREGDEQDQRADDSVHGRQSNKWGRVAHLMPARVLMPAQPQRSL